MFFFQPATSGNTLRLLARMGLLAPVLLFSGSALALTATTQFNVQITINAECQINSASDLNFGATGVIDTAVAATNAIVVQCTNGTTYDIGLNDGQNPAATIAARLMTGPGAQTVT
jgi:spore coat protein U-like protein